MTTDAKGPAFWPFLIVDALFFGLGVVLYQAAHRPLLWWEAAGLILCAACGAGVFLTPFLIRNAASQSLAEAEKLSEVIAKIQRLDELGLQISHATAQWQIVQDGAAKTAKTATDLAESMTAEAKSFTEFLQKANDTERAHLRLDNDKLRRSEGEWLQIVVYILDQVFALYQAAAQSDKPGVAESIGRFQHVCRDAARRAGLTAVVATAAEPFDAQRHQLGNGATAPANAVVQETVMPGYTFQGQMVRRPVVKLDTDATARI
jgi:molecular chaperone GrpE (heat shock protein)